MDMGGWDVIYASSVSCLNQVLAENSKDLLTTFSYRSSVREVALAGIFGAWSIEPGGTANRINLKTPIKQGTLTLGMINYSLDDIQPVLNVALTLIEPHDTGPGGPEPGGTEPQGAVQHLCFDITDMAPGPGVAHGGQIYMANPDVSGALKGRYPGGIVEAALQDALPECFLANPDKIQFVFASVFMSAPEDQPWLKPTGTAVSYFESTDKILQALAIKTVTQSPWPASSLSTGIDPSMLAPGLSMFFALSQAVFMRNLLLASLPQVIGNGVTPDCFQFTGPTQPNEQNASKIMNTRPFGVGSVENAGTSYYPQINSYQVTISGSQIKTMASGQFDVTGLAGAWVSFDNLEVVNEPYFDPGSKTVKFRLVGQTAPSFDKHIPDEYVLLGGIPDAIINAVLNAVENAVQDALQGEGDLSVDTIPLQTAVWTGLEAFDISQADLEQAFVIRGTAVLENDGNGGRNGATRSAQ